MTDSLIFYHIESNPNWQGFALHRGVFENINDPDVYAPSSFSVAEPILGQDLLICYRKDSRPKAPLQTAFSVASVSGRKPANPERALDTVVSAHARMFIEAIDPDIHRFHPVDLLHAKDRTPFGEDTYYIWRIGRSLRMALHAAGSAFNVTPDLTVERFSGAHDPMGRAFMALCHRGDAHERIRTLPFWCIEPWQSPFVSAQVYEQATALGLRGFELGTGITQRNATRLELPVLSRNTPSPRQERGLWKKLFGRGSHQQ